MAPKIILGMFPILVGATIFVWEKGDIAALESIGIILIDFVYLITLIAFLLYTIVKKASIRRNPDLKSSLYLTLTKAFALVTILPSTMLAGIASLGINIGLTGDVAYKFFDEVQVAGDTVISYFDIRVEELKTDSIKLATQLNRYYSVQPYIDVGELRRWFQSLTVETGSGKSFIIDSNCEIVVRGAQSYLYDFTKPPANYMGALAAQDDGIASFSSCAEELDREAFPNLTYSVGYDRFTAVVLVYQLPDSNQLHALTRLRVRGDQYLHLTIELIETLVDLQQSVAKDSVVFTGKVPELIRTLFNFSIILLAGGALLIFIVVPQGLIFANRISRPVKNLAQAAREIGEGNLQAKISTEGSDEIALFSRVFKEMVQKLDRSINDEIKARNTAQSLARELREVLANVTSGVIGLDTHQNVIFINKSALQKLRLSTFLPTSDTGEHSHLMHLSELVPEFVPILDGLAHSSDSTANAKLQLTRDDYIDHFLIKIAKRKDDKETLEGFVIAFDDVTELVNAERKAAWASVAQQIAHEIKNAFTPVSGALELLRDQVGTKFDENQIKPIVKYVDIVEDSMLGLLHISKEFSEFAKLPDPKLESVDLYEVCESARNAELHRGEEIPIELINNLESNHAHIDRILFRQVMINLLKNSREGICARKRREAETPFDPLIRILLEDENGTIRISVLDNGIGFSKNVRFSEYKKPFVTFNKESGSGLGLAYSDRIVEGHNGRLRLGIAPLFVGDTHRGALVTIDLPRLGRFAESKYEIA